jgi:hypothetical protein
LIIEVKQELWNARERIVDRTCSHVLGLHFVGHVFMFLNFYVLKHIFISLGLHVLGHVFMSLGLHILGIWDKQNFTRLCVNVV